jgi:hypothetical protein
MPPGGFSPSLVPRLPNCPILSESRAEERREGKSKDPQHGSPTMPSQGISTRGPKPFSSSTGLGTVFLVPSSQPCLPIADSSFNQRNLLLPSPAFQLLLAALCHIHVVVLFIVNKAITLVFLRESIDLTRFVLKNARVNETRHANIERARAAGHNINPEYVKAPFAHAGNGNTPILIETPCVGMAGDTSSGSFDSPLLLPSLVLAQDWAG